MKRFLVIIQLEANLPLARITKDMPDIVKMLTRHSQEQPLPALRLCFGVEYWL
ncbi:hypothetical protein [Rhizobium sp. SG2393]|uniref:hypothetical protein n=1 Tax=Rhizobium sp. SG2393 TaxID=3276279 RepID=UPI00366F60A8